MLVGNSNAMSVVRIVLLATAAGVLMIAIGVVLYKLFGLSALAAVLFAISCGVVRRLAGQVNSYLAMADRRAIAEASLKGRRRTERQA